MKIALLIGLGSFLGGISRYFVGKWFQSLFNLGFPFGTFLVNVLGCFLLGILIGIAEKYTFLTFQWRLVLMVGFCGSFTTFSTFASENMALIKEGQFLFFGIYTILSIVLGFAAVFGAQMIFK